MYYYPPRDIRVRQQQCSVVCRVSEMYYRSSHVDNTYGSGIVSFFTVRMQHVYPMQQVYYVI